MAASAWALVSWAEVIGLVGLDDPAAEAALAREVEPAQRVLSVISVFGAEVPVGSWLSAGSPDGRRTSPGYTSCSRRLLGTGDR